MVSANHLLAQRIQIPEEAISNAHDDPSPQEFCLMQDPFSMESSCYLPYAKHLLKNPIFIAILFIVVLSILFGIKVMVKRNTNKSS